jgi:hypothetical protein
MRAGVAGGKPCYIGIIWQTHSGSTGRAAYP